MSGHTPGPWHVDGEDIVSVDGTHVVCFGHDYDDYGGISARQELVPKGAYGSPEYDAEQAANELLIAAAPELLAACKAIVRGYDGPTVDIGTAVASSIDGVRAAIAKAEGTA